MEASEPQKQDANLAWLLTTVEALEQAHARDTARLEVLEHEIANSVKRRDSIELGTAGKGGQLKCYLDFTGSAEDNEKIIKEAQRLLKIAGGVPATGGA